MLLCCLGLGCSVFKTQILEFETVMQYNLVLDPDTKVPVKISGLSGASACCVREVTTRTNNATLTILVKIGLCNEGESGTFSYPIKVSDDIKELRFGTKEHLLWKRPQP